MIYGRSTWPTELFFPPPPVFASGCDATRPGGDRFAAKVSLPRSECITTVTLADHRWVIDPPQNQSFSGATAIHHCSGDNRPGFLELEETQRSHWLFPICRLAVLNATWPPRLIGRRVMFGKAHCDRERAIITASVFSRLSTPRNAVAPGKLWTWRYSSNISLLLIDPICVTVGKKSKQIKQKCFMNGWFCNFC